MMVVSGTTSVCLVVVRSALSFLVLYRPTWLVFAVPRLPPENKRFLEKHEERAVEEQRFVQSKAEEKYRLTHDYNPIAGTYYDQSRERHFAQSREKLQALQGRAQQHRLPPSIRYGEGNDYNIINQQVRRNNVILCLFYYC